MTKTHFHACFGNWRLSQSIELTSLLGYDFRTSENTLRKITPQDST
jgi:hypothetical protein